MFIGKESHLDNKYLLENAKALISDGRIAEEVRRITGWFIGPDNQWRFEISDKDVLS